MHVNRAGVRIPLRVVIVVSCEPGPPGFLAFPSQEKKRPDTSQSSLEPLLQQ